MEIRSGISDGPMITARSGKLSAVWISSKIWGKAFSAICARLTIILRHWPGVFRLLRSEVGAV
ncbi:MAG: hypothetical protein C4567_03795 [Deltaproteobacteria bacterium]|nr:MAG: hypothetical protein C4567_03795 [Deltaproteobacteria bacterium]